MNELNPRLAPQDVEAERAIIGGVLLTNAALDDVIEIVALEDFYRETHRLIYGAVLRLAEAREPIDLITLGDALQKSGDLESVGGSHYLAALDASVPVGANLAKYAKIVREKALARRMIEAALSIARDGYAPIADVERFVDDCESRIQFAGEGRTAKQFDDMHGVVQRVFANIEKLYERGDAITGMRSGFDLLDSMTAGWQRGDLIIVAGRPSMGKTAVALQMGFHAAFESDAVVAVFSLEMGADSLVTREFACEARVDGQRLRTGKLLDSDWPKLARAADKIHRAKVFIDDSAGLSAMEVRAKCRRLRSAQGPLGLVVVDYMQLMRGSGETREQEISEISRGLKELAKEQSVPVIALSQLNRSLEKREDKRPIMSDLRESGALEQDADVICFVYRDEVYNKTSADKGIAEIIVAKQRNGPTGDVRLAFLRDYTRFENLREGDR